MRPHTYITMLDFTTKESTVYNSITQELVSPVLLV